MVSNMNKRQLSVLTQVNLRLISPQVTDKLRKKGKAGKRLTKSLLNQYISSGLIFILIYGFLMLSLDFHKFPGIFTYYVALFVLMGVTQAISAIYNIFFEGADLPGYLPLPLRNLEIFLAKIIVVLIGVIPFILPMVIIFFMLSWRAGIMIPLAVLLALVVFILFTAVVLAASSLVVFGLTKTKFFQQHKKTATSLLLGLTMIFMMVGIFFTNMKSSSAGANTIDTKPLQIFMPLYHLLDQPFSGAGLLGLGIFVVLLGILLLVIRQWILPDLFTQLTQSNTDMGGGTRKHRLPSGLRPLLGFYNRQLLKEPNLIMQVISTTLMAPLIFLMSFGLGGRINLSRLSFYPWFGVFFVGGIVLAALITDKVSFVANLISLDKQNYEFVQALPLSLNRYLREKFRLGFLIQALMGAVVALIAAFVVHIPPLLLVMTLLGVVYGAYYLSHYYFIRDFRLHLPDWTNINQLFSRGGDNFSLVLVLGGSMILGALAVVGYASAVTWQPIWANVIAAVILLVVAGVLSRYFQRSFWRRLD
ncbi:ABC transporter [Lapidilactobacillus luobeiensis]|uniref:ABC transporter n=1 Tax=Lapidilactobacillus luobeiensis TaxID=2950371 RepID=UPI0021C45902|nr:ABC transporter [Lapidilactobacillus luobeiensis]